MSVVGGATGLPGPPASSAGHPSSTPLYHVARGLKRKLEDAQNLIAELLSKHGKAFTGGLTVVEVASIKLEKDIKLKPCDASSFRSGVGEGNVVPECEEFLKEVFVNVPGSVATYFVSCSQQ